MVAFLKQRMPLHASLNHDMYIIIIKETSCFLQVLNHELEFKINWHSYKSNPQKQNYFV